MFAFFTLQSSTLICILCSKLSDEATYLTAVFCFPADMYMHSDALPLHPATRYTIF